MAVALVSIIKDGIRSRFKAEVAKGGRVVESKYGDTVAEAINAISSLERSEEIRFHQTSAELREEAYSALRVRGFRRFAGRELL